MLSIVNMRRFYPTLFVLLLLPLALYSKNFTVVLDAGHGGHDPGAVGRITKEKTINLSVALKVGKLIESQCPDVRVIYTRKNDTFVPLQKRAEIANKAKADLFISIHTNSVAGSSRVRGASTWTLGLATSDANLEVAKRENAVILYEDDYKTTYAGFNPNSAESYIIFEFMQDRHMKQSVHLAKLMQKEFKQTSNRVDKGVHQAGFLVLKATAMPSVLIELGFISTPEEERFLNTESGRDLLAKGIFNGFIRYKNEQTQNTEPIQSVVQPNIKEPTTSLSSKSEVEQSPVFKIQILTSPTLLKKNDRRLKGLKEIDYYEENGLYKYTYKASTDYRAINAERKKIVHLFKDAFIIAFTDNKKTDINEAIRLYRQHN